MALVKASKYADFIVPMPFMDRDEEPNASDFGAIYPRTTLYETGFCRMLGGRGVNSQKAKPTFANVSDMLDSHVEADPDAIKSHYSIDGEMDFEMSLCLTDNITGATKTVPLIMYPYITPDMTNLDNVDCWNYTDSENANREKFNKSVLLLLNKFISKYGCGTSANSIVGPADKPDIGIQRKKRVKEILGDKEQSSNKAILYLSSVCKMYCGLDYMLEDAVWTADAMSFISAVHKMIDSGRIRVSIPGEEPSWWDGKSEKCEAGYYVSFKKGRLHSFVFPQVLFTKSRMEWDGGEPKILRDLAKKIVERKTQSTCNIKMIEGKSK